MAVDLWIYCCAICHSSDHSSTYSGITALYSLCTRSTG
ncbi:unnamed protein product [Cylicostephanus goldi]|uniref:Uncharacterized protein n=1 Tax=Cylicostephanus goldi TaxID=71465 RepID=A0A3P6SAR2_CYLGO|nr:unnamed protein product [Cylicostephanus goldi]